ncbi:TrbI/VirB10 family protein [Pusillimonas noertemannii]|uniref:Type IV secretion system protein VirB10 n=1 Tax=Pusillimonas noertemannii TaxID=305977 RepID=A0A2U1CM56_9BURK|nr:TrbI/VirB10 family protein [Pusillimonas noertemannii]NYT68880.1 TrbI/VirB10 family protein [Pusillimonas noertemannii]PVY62099.1 type IV secretion system protein VirB10 [Pusillimonas noertemannii]TFL10906.1 TrbI/VirB10 family protein [Pusillimonas noertemannii]
MIGERTDDASDVPPKAPPESMELRAAAPSVTRLNRRTLAVLAGSVAAVVLGATMWSLQPHKRASGPAEELYNVDRISRAEGLASLPRDYSQVVKPPADPVPAPVLGDPLPGDLGRPMLRAEREASLQPHGGPDAAEVERQARLKEAQDAARAPLFYKSGPRADAQASASAPASGMFGMRMAGVPGESERVDPVQTQNMQDNKAAFANQSAAATQSLHGLQAPRAPDTLMAGTIIPGALVTGIKSDLPGDIIATVTEPVYDSATGRHVLIPQGSRLMGRYNSQVAYGQSRVQAVWDRIILPDTSSVALDNLAAADPTGYAGLEDQVDWHWDRILAGAALTTLLGVGAELAAPENRSDGDRIIIAGRDSLQDNVNQAGQEMTRRSMNIQPTLTARPGLPVRVIVNRDIALRPYRPLFINR